MSSRLFCLGDVVQALTGQAAVGNTAVSPSPSLPTTPIIDSRHASEQPNPFFIAFRGENVDGHDYVPAAFQHGARAAIVERPVGEYPVIDCRTPASAPVLLPETPFLLLVENSEAGLQQVARHWRQQFPALQVVGVTGSVGKTSTKEVIHAVLAQKYATLKTEGNFNNEIGLPLTLLKLTDSYTHAVLEMGMYAQGEIALLCDIAQPQIGVVTIIGPVHMSRLGSLAAIVAAKQELVEALPMGGTAVLNHDDPNVMSMAPHTQANIFTYGLNRHADLWASNVTSQGLNGIAFTLHYRGESLRVHAPLLGQHSVHTCLRATAVGLLAGLSWEEIIHGLQSQRSQLRLVTVRGPRNSTLLDDTYNASPDSVIAALNLLQELDGRHIAVLGDMLELGSAEEVSHRLVGRRAKEVVDILVTVGARGRIIGEEALNFGMAPQNVHIVPDNNAAIHLLNQLIQPKDFILVKGSLGARMDHIVAALSRTKDNRTPEEMSNA
jgi:UDP-N-acetylmuramoyl-tripeptide--D-alanyl-D-alanine ligase